MLPLFALLACSPRTSGVSPPEPTPQPTATQGPLVWDVVRKDGTPVGRVETEREAPFRMKVVSGDVAALVKAASALDHVTSSGGSEVLRSDGSFPRIFRFGWLDEQGYLLRLAALTPDTRTWHAAQFQPDGTHVSLGAVTMNDQHYLTEVSADLSGLATAWNKRDGEGMDIPPPPGSLRDGVRGHYGRAVPRGSDEFLDMLRFDLATKNVAFTPEALPAEPLPLHTFEHRGRRPWGSLRTPGALSSVAVSPPVLLALSGPPGGPLSLQVRAYEDVDPVAGLSAHVVGLHGSEAGFEVGDAVTVVAAGRDHRGVAYRTGVDAARTDGVVMFWPTLDRSTGKTPTDEGLSIDLQVGGRGASIDVAGVVGHPALGVALQTLVVDPDGW